MLNKNFTTEEVKKATMRLKTRKSVEVDLLPNEILKNYKAIEILTELFQLCFDISIIPENWSKSIIKPIPKSANDDPRIPLNYRGISLISCVAKLFSSILNERISMYLETNNILADEQNGFRKKRSCTDSLHSILKNRKLNGRNNFVTFIDFSKAFDSLDRKMLLHKILHN